MCIFRAFIICHLEKVAKPSNRNVLSIGGTVTAISIALGYGDRFSHLKPHFLGGQFGVGTLHHMHIINTRGDAIRCPHHKHILFIPPNVARTTVTNRRKLNCDQLIVRAIVLPHEDQFAADEVAEYNDEGGIMRRMMLMRAKRDPRLRAPMLWRKRPSHLLHHYFTYLFPMRLAGLLPLRHICHLTPLSFNPSPPSKWRVRVFGRATLVW